MNGEVAIEIRIRWCCDLYKATAHYCPAGLAASLVLGPRKGFGVKDMKPHNTVYTMIGGSLLWVGWFVSPLVSLPSPSLHSPKALSIHLGRETFYFALEITVIGRQSSHNFGFLKPFFGLVLRIEC